MTTPVGTTTYHYDTTSGNLDKITSPEGKEFTYSYNHGQLAGLTYPNGITASYGFDSIGNLTDLNYTKSGSSVRRYQYGYDKNNMRTSMTDVDGVHSYLYDSLYQLVQATHPTPQNPLEQFAYDQTGNRLSDNVKSAYQYNELNQLTEDDSCKYLYDLDGNQTEKISKSTGDTTVYTYDIENKLVQVQKPGMLAKYAYDAMGRRMAKTVNGTSMHYRYDGDNLILEMSGNDSVIANYTFGTGVDKPLMVYRNGNSYYYVKDGLGSVTAIANNNGNIVQEYKYNVYGKILEQKGDSIENTFTYTSRELEKEFSIYFYRARFYDPTTGRFLSEDPVSYEIKASSSGGCKANKSGNIIYRLDHNLFQYAKNNPVELIDPYGYSANEPDKGRDWGPYYGNWCGPGNTGKPPIDALDQACQNHDNCYTAAGVNWWDYLTTNTADCGSDCKGGNEKAQKMCQCNKTFCDEISNVKKGPGSTERFDEYLQLARTQFSCGLLGAK